MHSLPLQQQWYISVELSSSTEKARGCADMKIGVNTVSNLGKKKIKTAKPIDTEYQRTSISGIVIVSKRSSFSQIVLNSAGETVPTFT